VQSPLWLHGATINRHSCFDPIVTNLDYLYLQVIDHRAVAPGVTARDFDNVFFPDGHHCSIASATIHSIVTCAFTQAANVCFRPIGDIGGLGPLPTHCGRNRMNQTSC
jgi:hypothetical protein